MSKYTLDVTVELTQDRAGKWDWYASNDEESTWIYDTEEEALDSARAHFGRR